MQLEYFIFLSTKNIFLYSFPNIAIMRQRNAIIMSEVQCIKPNINPKVPGAKIVMQQISLKVRTSKRTTM